MKIILIALAALAAALPGSYSHATVPADSTGEKCCDEASQNTDITNGNWVACAAWECQPFGVDCPAEKIDGIVFDGKCRDCTEWEINHGGCKGCTDYAIEWYVPMVECFLFDVCEICIGVIIPPDPCPIPVLIPGVICAQKFSEEFSWVDVTDCTGVGVRNCP